VNRNRIADFHSKKTIPSIADSLGTLVTISGTTFYAHVGTPRNQTTLELGGYSTETVVNLRWPIGRYPKPAHKTPILLVAENKTYFVSEQPNSLKGSPLGQEIHVTAISSSK
jgi:hypothetical protein